MGREGGNLALYTVNSGSKDTVEAGQCVLITDFMLITGDVLCVKNILQTEGRVCL